MAGGELTENIVRAALPDDASQSQEESGSGISDFAAGAWSQESVRQRDSAGASPGARSASAFRYGR